MPNNEMCALYLMQDTLSGDTKIGITNNPKERKKEVEQKYNVGEVISTTIDKYLYISMRDLPSFYGTKYRIYHSGSFE